MKLLLFILISIAFISCRKDETPIFRSDKLEGEKAILIGTWEWAYTYQKLDICVPPFYYSTLDSSNSTDTYRLRFLEEGFVEFYINDLITDVGYMNIIGWSPAEHPDFFAEPENRKFTIYLDADETNYILGEISQDTLMLYPFYFPFDDVVDGTWCEYHWSYFVRQ